MITQNDIRNNLTRLGLALEALAADLDAIEKRPHYSLRDAARTCEDTTFAGIERFVDHFAFVVNKAGSQTND